MAGSRHIKLLELREPFVEQVAPLSEEPVTLLAEDREHWASDPGCVLRPEFPMPECGDLDGEQGIGVHNGLCDPSGDAVLDDLLAAPPWQPGHDSEEVGDRLFLVASPVGSKCRADFVIEGRAARHDEEVGLQERQGTDDLRGVQRQLHRDETPVRMAGDVCSVDAQMHEQRGGVRSLVGDGDRPLRMRTASHATAVVANQPVVIPEGRLGKERLEAVCQKAGMDEQDRLARTRHVALELDAVEAPSLHLLFFTMTTRLLSVEPVPLRVGAYFGQGPTSATTPRWSEPRMVKVRALPVHQPLGTKRWSMRSSRGR
jgi:hypothetical protein